MVELMVALAIGGMIMALAIPASVRFYDAMQERQALRDTVNLLASARGRALSSGRAQDVFVRPAARTISFGEREYQLPDRLRMTVHGAAELNLNNVGVIRFYPGGGSSGGGIDIRRDNGTGTSIAVDWLVGTVSQSPLQGSG